jgi:hypothetical protein
MCLGVAALFGVQSPEIMAQNPGSSAEDVMLGSGMLLCLGAALLIIPILVGALTFWVSKKEDPVNIDYIPPAS